MALGIYVTAKGFTQERYDTTLRQLEATGTVLDRQGIDFAEPTGKNPPLPDAMVTGRPAAKAASESVKRR